MGNIDHAEWHQPGTSPPTLGTLRIRPAGRGDAAVWATLRHQLWPEESASELSAEAAGFFEGADAQVAQVLLAESSEGGVIGFAELSLRPYAEECSTSPVAFLEGWYVVPAARRQGVGRALVRAAEEWGRRQGCREFASDTPIDNVASIAAHQTLGFEDAGALRCFRKDL
jgi:aminoglycoside 6'-N-acetyltransferase I